MKIDARQKLIDAIVENSEADTWDDAVQEWSMIHCSVDSSCSSQCVCGQESIKYLFEIRNEYNGNLLFPIGSRCIHKFGRKDLNEQVSVYEQMCKLLEAVKNREYISFGSDMFSKKLLKYLYENGAFTPSPYNMNNPYNDYLFMLDMFNKRSDPTIHQKKKINAIVLKEIIPFCRSQIESIE